MKIPAERVDEPLGDLTCRVVPTSNKKRKMSYTCKTTKLFFHPYNIEVGKSIFALLSYTLCQRQKISA